MKLWLMNVRGAFLNVFVPKTVNGEGDPAYSGAWIYDPSTPEGKATHAKLVAAEEQVAKDKWIEKAPAILKSIRAANKGLIGDGNTKAEYAGYADMEFVNTRSKTAPLVIGRKVPGDKGKSVIAASEGIVYSGAYYNVEIDVWAQDNNYGKRINAGLKGVQFVRGGDAFSGEAVPSNVDDAPDLADTGEDDDGGDLA